MIDCPVCNESWTDDTPSCSCGFDFTTRSPHLAITRFTRDARRGNATWRRGLIGLFFLPVTISLGFTSPAAWLVAMAQLGLSAIWIVQGLVRADVANRKLAAAKELVQLPAARVVRR